MTHTQFERELADSYPSRATASGTAILERPDPTVWGEPATIPLPSATVSRYDRDGYCVLPTRLSTRQLDLLRSEFTALSHGPRDPADPRWIYEADGSVRSIFDIDLLSPAIGEVIAELGVAELAAAILADDVMIHQSRMNAKPGFGAEGFYWHSDFETWHAEDGMPRPRALSFSIALSDNRVHNGPLMIMPGSHRKFLACVGHTPDDFHAQSLTSGRRQIGMPDNAQLDAVYQQAGIDTITCDAGEIVMFDSNCVHASAENLSPQGRRNLFLVFNAVTNRLRDVPYAAARPRPPHLARR